jgi:hypothetical protein
LRIAVAENIAFLVRDHVRVDSISYEQLRAQNTLGPVQAKWETPVLLVGDFNDEPFDIAVVDHLQASSELDRVTGSTNDINGFKAETADYRGDDTFLYNASWRFLEPENLGSFFITSTPAGEVFPNRYQVLDNSSAAADCSNKQAYVSTSQASTSTAPLALRPPQAGHVRSTAPR